MPPPLAGPRKIGMKLAAGFRRFWTVDEVSRADVQSLLAAARALRRAPAGSAPLAGKHVAVLYRDPSSASAEVLTAAAAALGAKVTHVKTSEALADPRDLQAMARMLGRLYDAVACDANDHSTLIALERDSGVPVFNGVAHAMHPTRLLADVMTMQEAIGDSQQPPMLCVAGQPAESRAAWNQLAALTDLRVCTRPDPPPHDDAVHANGFFHAANGVRPDDGNTALRQPGGTDDAALARQHKANHAALVQALLMQAIG